MPGLKNTLARLTIESLSSDGSGVGRLNGKAVFVPATAPGDDATVKIVKDMRWQASAKAIYKERGVLGYWDGLVSV